MIQNKFNITVLLVLIISYSAYSQRLSMKVGTNPTLINASAALEVESNSKGFLPPRMTNAQRNAIVSPVPGLMVWCTNCGKTGELQVFNGSIWVNYVANTTESVVTARVPTSTGGTLIFMAHNLGADTSADPLVPSWKLNGAYIQWGKRGPTGNWANAVSNGLIGFGAAPTGDNLPTANNLAISGWSTTVSTASSWNVTESSPIKTANDPCPTGFRVPTRNEWVSIYSATPINTQNNWSNIGPWNYSDINYTTGKLVNSSMYLPAAGNRDFTDGKLYNRGIVGFYSSSTPSAQSPYYLIFSNNSIQIENINSPLYGISVRFVSE